MVNPQKICEKLSLKNPLSDLYDDKLEMTLPVLDGLGRVVQDAIDHWEPRQGLALALQNLAGSLGDEPNLIEKAQ